MVPHDTMFEVHLVLVKEIFKLLPKCIPFYTIKFKQSITQDRRPKPPRIINESVVQKHYFYVYKLTPQRELKYDRISQMMSYRYPKCIVFTDGIICNI